MSAARPLPAICTAAVAIVVATAVAQPPPLEAHPAIARAPRHTRTKHGHQGDPVNVAFVGTDEELHRVLAAAGWYAADPITLTSRIPTPR